MHVLQVLRGLTPNAILTGNMRPSQHKHWKLRATTGEASDSQQQNTVADAQHLCSDTLKQSRPSTTATCEAGRKNSRERSHSCEGGSSAADRRPHDAQINGEESPRFAPDGTEKLSEEERRARKRAKKLRQKLAQETDPERKAREKLKRAKRRALKKAKPSQTT